MGSGVAALNSHLSQVLSFHPRTFDMKLDQVDSTHSTGLVNNTNHPLIFSLFTPEGVLLGGNFFENHSLFPHSNLILLHTLKLFFCKKNSY